jgi:hypothetical protein
MKWISALLSLAIVVGIASCEDDKTASPADVASILISKTWETGYVRIDGTDVTDLGYLLMQLTFAKEGTWTATNSNDLFVASGIWKFGATNAKLLLGSREIDIVLNPEGSTLTMRFSRNGNESIGGRTNKAGGSYEIYLIPKFSP